MRVTGALRYRNFRRFAFANLASVTGTWMQVVAQNWLVLRLSGHAAAVGITVALQAGPSVALGLTGGVVADRMSKRQVLCFTQSALAVCAVALGCATLARLATVGLVYVMAFVLGLVMAIDSPSNAALGAELVPQCDLGNAIALGSTLNGIGRIVGMSVAGVLVAMTGPGWIFMLNGVSYLVVVGAVCSLRADELRAVEVAPRDATRMRDALHYARSSPTITLAAAIAFVVAAFGRNYQVTMAAMSRVVFHAGAEGYGVASMAFAVGAVFGGIAATRVRNHELRLVIIVALLGSALEVISGLMPNVSSFAMAMVPIALAAVAFDAITLSVVQLAAGDAFRGRITALLGCSAMLGATIGAPSLGWLADHAGARASLEIGGGIVMFTVCAIALACSSSPSVWQLRTRLPLMSSRVA